MPLGDWFHLLACLSAPSGEFLEPAHPEGLPDRPHGHWPASQAQEPVKKSLGPVIRVHAARPDAHPTMPEALLARPQS